MAILAVLAVGILILAIAAGISWLMLEALMFALRRSLADAQNGDVGTSSPLTIAAVPANEA